MMPEMPKPFLSFLQKPLEHCFSTLMEQYEPASYKYKHFGLNSQDHAADLLDTAHIVSGPETVAMSYLLLRLLAWCKLNIYLRDRAPEREQSGLQWPLGRHEQ